MVKEIGGWSYVVAGLGLVVAAGAVILGAFEVWDRERAYWTMAVATSVFQGFGSLAIWGEYDPARKDGLPLWPWRVHKWSVNGLGFFAGFYAAHLLTAHLAVSRDFSVGVFTLGLVAMLGLGGYIPKAVFGFASAFGLLAEKAAHALTK